MSTAAAGNKVSVSYVGKLDDGTVFDTSEGGEPIAFTIGEGNVIPGFENAVLGMNVGEKKSFTIECDDAYGPRNPELVQDVPRSQVMGEEELKVGDRLRAMTPDQRTIALTVVDVSDETVKLDANHPLAGQDLHFEIELLTSE